MPRRIEAKYPLTIYELDNSISLTEYRRILRNKVKAQRNKTIKDSGIDTAIEGIEIYYFSYTNDVDTQDITWHKQWRTFFTKIEEPLVRNSKTGHGIIIVFDKAKQKKFAIVFGRAFSLLKDYYIRDFGIKLATRLFDSNTVEVVSSKYFSMIKNKQIIDYKDEYSLQADEGQAVDFLQARITEDIQRREDPEQQYINNILNQIKPDAAAGYSFIKVTLYGDTITLELLIEALDNLAHIQSYDERFELPVMKPVNKTLAHTLDHTLLSRIKSEEEDFNISVPFFGYDDSDRFAFFDDIDGYTLSYGEIESAYDGKLDNEVIKNFILEYHDAIANIRELQVSVIINGEPRPKECLLKWVDADLLLEDRNYAIYDGDWVEFNQVYLEYLDRSVAKYEAQCLIEKPELSFSSEEADIYRGRYPNELIDRFFASGTGRIEKVYKEFVYNFALSQKNNWFMFDRCFGNQIEICDIYIRNEQYVHVKIGDASGLDEVFRQSILGLRYAEQNKHRWGGFRNYDNEPISGAETCSVIFLSENRTGELPRLTESKSLRCKMTFVDWVIFMKERGKTPKIYIGVYTPNMLKGLSLSENLPAINLN